MVLCCGLQSFQQDSPDVGALVDSFHHNKTVTVELRLLSVHRESRVNL